MSVKKETNMTAKPIDRRVLLAAAAASVVSLPFRALAAATRIAVTKDPNCSCCSGWVDHLKKSGFDVAVTESSDLTATKARLGIPTGLAACHTAEVDGYAIEGHVPSAAIRRLLTQRPFATGLAVPGMPAGSPGMEVEGTAPEIYDVVIFGGFGQRPFARFRGDVEVS
jgi:hypothetical protein